ncbi:MAG: nucleotidyltransferase [Rudaea sp.]
MELSRDLKDFLRLLVAHEVQFMLVGAHAIAFHSFPRNTGDIDVWVRRTHENARRILAALDEFGFGEIGLTTDDLVDPNKVIQLGREPNRIDMLTFLTGLDFEECMARSVSASYEGIEVKVIGLEDLVANKKATGRAKDVLDVEELERRGLVRK